MNGLVQFEASHTDAELWQTFVSTVEELQPYLQPSHGGGLQSQRRDRALSAGN